MNHWFTSADAPLDSTFVKRFTPLHWSVDFPRGAMASITEGEDACALRIDVEFLRRGDIVGLIWDSEDRDSHPAQARETARDYRGCTLRFRWQSQGVSPLDDVNGAVLTIEAADGRAWYVRLWNYAVGSGTDAVVTLDFDALDGGFVLPAEAARVDPSAIERMFIGLTPPDYLPSSEATSSARGPGWISLSELSSDGGTSTIACADAFAPVNGLGIATAYDDLYHRCPRRIVDEIGASGYRGTINHYVGMSHYPALGADGRLDPTRNMCAPALAWHRSLARAAKADGFRLIWSLSFEMLEQLCPDAWKQRFFDGEFARTGYSPPSSLLSPANGEAIAYLGRVAAELVGISIEVGLEPLIQVGEPWWWVETSGRIALYDAQALAAFGGNPAEIADVGAVLQPVHKALLDQAGSVLAAATGSVVEAARAAAPGVTSHLLVFLPGILDPARPEARRANLPPGWAKPAFDVLQIEDYDWLTAGADARRAAARQEVEERLGYARNEQHYLAGFATGEDKAVAWERILAGAREARTLGVAETMIWAWPQVARDGLTLFGEDEDVEEFAEVDFPIAIGQEASVSPTFSTNVVTSISGHEYRNINWSEARLRFDAGPGVRSEQELVTLIDFFRARRGRAVAFRFRDPFDFSSASGGSVPTALDQRVGEGDGVQSSFMLCKYYGDCKRFITRPVGGSVRVAIGGEERSSGWTIAGGVVHFDDPPAVGEAVTAGFLFDVPVRFAEDRIDINRVSFAAGEAPSVPLIEIREDGR